MKTKIIDQDQSDQRIMINNWLAPSFDWQLHFARNSFVLLQARRANTSWSSSISRWRGLLDSCIDLLHGRSAWCYTSWCIPFLKQLIGWFHLSARSCWCDTSCHFLGKHPTCRCLKLRILLRIGICDRLRDLLRFLLGRNWIFGFSTSPSTFFAWRWSCRSSANFHDDLITTYFILFLQVTSKNQNRVKKNIYNTNVKINGWKTSHPT